MRLIGKTKKFLKVGTCAGACVLTGILGLNMVGDMAPQGQKLEGYSATIMENAKNGIDTISYKLFDVALTQPTEIYRYNVLDSLAKGHVHSIISEFGKEIREQNLEVAKKLGIFTDTSAFKAEVELLNQNIKGGTDIAKLGHYIGIDNIDEAKERAINALQKIRENNSNEIKNKLKI